jgi:hypothetical protein
VIPPIQFSEKIRPAGLSQWDHCLSHFLTKATIFDFWVIRLNGCVIGAAHLRLISRSIPRLSPPLPSIGNKSVRYVFVNVKVLDSDGAIFALQEIVRQIQDGYTSGFNSNKEGESFSWDSDLQIGD